WPECRPVHPAPGLKQGNPLPGQLPPPHRVHEKTRRWGEQYSGCHTGEYAADPYQLFSILACLMTWAHLLCSAATNSSNSWGDCGFSSIPSILNFSCTSGMARMACISL